MRIESVIIEKFVTMHLLVILFLISSNWLNAGAEFHVEDAEYFSYGQEILDELGLQGSLNNLTGHADQQNISLSQSLQQLSSNIRENLKDVRSLITPSNYQEEIIDELLLVEALVNSIWKTLSRISECPDRISASTINRMRNALNTIHLNLTKYKPILKNNLLTWIGQLSDNHQYAFCKKNTSNHLAYNILKNVKYVHIRVYVAAIKYYEHNPSHGRNGQIISRYTQALLEKFYTYSEIGANVRKSRPSAIYSCDIGDYIRDENYIEIEGLVQPIFITNNLGSCEAANMKANITHCPNLQRYPRDFGIFGTMIVLLCNNEEVELVVSGRDEKPCYGYLSHCAPLKSREVCRNNMNAKPNTLKRFSWYKINNEMFGKEDSCPKGQKEAVRSEDSGSIYHCHCTCHDNGLKSPTTHVLSITWSLSDIDENKVVTGVKFTRIDKVIHLQIKQGILIREGRILPGSENWKPVPNINLFKQNDERNDTWRNVTFVVLDENMMFDLDDVIAESQWAITGVRFHQLENGRIKLMIRQTRYDLRTGVLHTENIHTRINPNSNTNELPVSLINPALHHPRVPNTPDSTSNLHYVKLRESSRKGDGGGTILPFFDAQKVEMVPSSPLSGIGLYHRGSSESAGFISLKLITPDYSRPIAGGT